MYSKLKEISGHSAGIYSMAFDGTFLYSASADRYVTRWNLNNGSQDTFAIKFDSSVYSCLIINEGKNLIAGLSSGHFHVFDLHERKEIKFFTQHKCGIFAMEDNSIKEHFYVGDAEGNLSVWNSKTFDLLLFLPLDCGKIRRFSVNEDGSLLAICSQDGVLRIFDTVYFNELYSFKAHNEGLTSAVFNPNCPNEIITGGKDAIIRKWDYTTGEMKGSVPGHNFVVYDLICMGDNKQLVSASRDKTIKVFNIETLSFLQRLDFKEGGHRHSVNCLIKLDEKSFVSGSDDKRMIIWTD